MKQQELIEKLNMFLNESDPQHALLFLGITKASEWIKQITKSWKESCFDYFEKKLSINGDLPIKEQIIKILQQVGGSDSIKFLDRIISEGDSKHGEYIVKDAINAKAKIK